MSAMNLPPGVTAAGAGDIAGMSGFSADPNQQAQKQEQDAQKAQILKQILTPEALERLGRVKIVKTAKAEALEKLHNDVSRTKWRMGQERKVADEERKQLARMLLGMGEKISTNALPSDAITDTDGEEPPPKIALG